MNTDTRIALGFALIYTLIPMLRLPKWLLCSHSWTHHRNIYGDEINYLNARSEWRCTKCGAYQLRPELHEDPKPTSQEH